VYQSSAPNPALAEICFFQIQPKSGSGQSLARFQMDFEIDDIGIFLYFTSFKESA
jgi:hypothetical protein